MLFAPHGWRITKNLSTETQVLAVDRHGKVVETTIRLEQTENRSQLAYLGTGGAFAALVPDTRVLANDGKRWMVKTLVESGDVSSVHFETLVRIPDFVRPNPSVDDLWQCLSDASAIGNSESLALRCRDPVLAASLKSAFPQKKQVGDQVFAIVRRQELASALDENWREAITNLVTCWLKDGADNRVEIERSSYYLALWFATALAASRSGYAFQYDSIQHSSYVFVMVTQQAARPLQPGACAFYSPHDTRVVSISWNDPSLAPIAAGFLIAAD